VASLLFIINSNIFVDQKFNRMKKRALLLFLAGGTIAFTACSSNSNQANNQALVDSLANAKAAVIQAQMSAKNDSIINAKANEKASAMMNERAEGKREERRAERNGSNSVNNASTATPVDNTPATPTNTGKMNTSQQSQGTNTGKKQ